MSADRGYLPPTIKGKAKFADLGWGFRTLVVVGGFTATLWVLGLVSYVVNRL